MKKFLSIALLMLTTGIAAQELQLTAAEQHASDSVSAPVIEDDQSVSTNACPYLDRIKGQYYLDDTPIHRKEVRNFLENNNPEAWKKYRTGNGLMITGISLLGAGAACFCAGTAIFSVDAMANALLVLPSAFSGDYSDMRDVRPALAIILGGGLLLAGSVPCMTIGILYKTRAHEIYNRNCAEQPQLELSLQASQNGLGFALKF